MTMTKTLTQICMLCENPEITGCDNSSESSSVCGSDCGSSCDSSRGSGSECSSDSTHQVCKDCLVVCPATNQVKCFFCEYNCDNCSVCERYGKRKHKKNNN